MVLDLIGDELCLVAIARVEGRHDRVGAPVSRKRALVYRLLCRRILLDIPSRNVHREHVSAGFGVC